MRLKKICFVVGGYPYKDEPVYTFIQTTVAAIADKGIECTVIAPQSIPDRILRKKSFRPEEWIDETREGNKIRILQPKYISLSNKCTIGGNLSTLLGMSAVKKAWKRKNVQADVLYGHFWDKGIIAAEVSAGKIPVVVATGESKIRVENLFPKRIIEKNLSSIKGVISVSTKNTEESIHLGLIQKEMKTILLPNAIASDVFCKKDRQMMREKLGLPSNTVIAAFTGTFCERKGVLRVVEASRGIPNLKLILIGSGEQKPESDQILFCGKLAHEEIADYLNAADLFVLPTRAEGCCNAIIEALACGLPVISSNRTFNLDVLNSENAILIDPDNVDEINMALNKLVWDSELRLRMEKSALQTAAGLQIEERCSQIVHFLEKVVDG